MTLILRKLSLILCFFAFFVAMASPCTARQGGDDARQAKTRFVSVENAYLSDADFEGNRGSMAVLSSGVSIRPWKYTTIGYTFRNYTWGDTARLGFGNRVDDPWKNLHGLYLGLGHMWRLNETWSVFGGVFGYSGFEKQMDGSFGAGLRSGFGYTFENGLFVRLGASYFKDSVDNTVIPLFGIGFTPWADSLARSGWFASLGFPNTRIGYRFNPEWALWAQYEWDRAAARLADDSTVLPEGHIRQINALATFAVQYQPAADLMVSLGLIHAFGRTLHFYNKDGRVLGGLDLDNAFGGELEMRWAF
jgi:hypothetical protein